MTPELLKLADLRLDSDAMKLRDHVRPDVVEEYATLYAEHGDAALPPLEVFFDGETYWPGGGQHRVAARRKCGKDDILAHVWEGGEVDAFRNSCSENRHGERWSPGELRRVLLRWIGREPDLSNRQLARHVGCNEKSVRNARAAIAPQPAPVVDFPPVDFPPPDVGADSPHPPKPVPTPRGAGSPPPAPLPEPPAAGPLDALGQLVTTPAHVEAFLVGREMTALANQLALVKKRLIEISKTPAGEMLDIEKVGHDLLDVIRFVRHAVPHCLIPSALLNGKRPLELKWKERGWLTRYQWEAVTEQYPELRT